MEHTASIFGVEGFLLETYFIAKDVTLLIRTVCTSKMAETISVTIWHQNARNLCACELSNAKSYKSKSRAHIPEYYSLQGQI
jgi:hypothetical protein